MGIFFAIICAATWSAAIILFKKAAADLHPVLINLCKNWIGTLLMIPTVLIFAPFAFSDIATSDLLILVISGILGIGIADALVLKSLSAIGASRLAIVECAYSPLVILIAILHLGESLNRYQSARISLVLLSIFLITPKKTNADQVTAQTSRLGIILGVLGIFSMAIGITIVKPIFDRVDLLPIVLIRLAAGSIASILVLPVLSIPLREIRQVFKVPNKAWFYGACVLSTYVSMMFWVAGFKFNDVSIASVLNQTSTIFTVVFAAIFLREKITARVISATMIAIAGVLMATLYS